MAGPTLFEKLSATTSHSSMSTTDIPAKTRELLFGHAAGRCQYRGCNHLLTEDDLTKQRGKFSVFAHIIADEPGGPRGDPQLSKLLAKDISNLMLLCLKHHKLIDVVDVGGHPVELLREFKKRHEDRIRRLTEIDDQHGTVLVYMEGNIGQRKGLVDPTLARAAVLPRYPEEEFNIDLGHSRQADGANWAYLTAEIDAAAPRIHDLLVRSRAKHLSIFAIAPIPILMYLGRALGDLAPGESFQCHRWPHDWTWKLATGSEPEFTVGEAWPVTGNRDVALILSVSEEVNLEMVRGHLGSSADGYVIGVARPSNGVIRCREQTGQFMDVVRQLLGKIKARHGASAIVHVYPALPNSLAVEFGRCLLPKTDPQIKVYDLNRFHSKGGLHLALELLQRL